MDYVRTPLLDTLEVPNIVSLHYFPYTKDFYFAGESHDFWELIIVDSGEVTVCEAEPVILKQGDGFLHAPDRYHSIWANNVFSNIIIITFDCGEPRLCERAGKLTVGTGVKYLAGLIIGEARKALAEPLDLVIQERLNFKESLPFGSQQLIKNALEMILIQLIRGGGESLPSAKKSPNSILAEKIETLLRNNLNKKISIEEIARTVGYCPTHIKKVFRFEKGESIIEHFIHLKIAEAKRLLSENELSVSQISELLGFDSVQYFSSQFKKRTNMTPSQYIYSTEGILK